MCAPAQHFSTYLRPWCCGLCVVEWYAISQVQFGGMAPTSLSGNIIIVWVSTLKNSRDAREYQVDVNAHMAVTFPARLAPVACRSSKGKHVTSATRAISLQYRSARAQNYGTLLDALVSGNERCRASRPLLFSFRFASSPCGLNVSLLQKSSYLLPKKTKTTM